MLFFPRYHFYFFGIQVLFEASHPHDLEVMVSGASATWLGIDVGCWLLGWIFEWPVGGSKETIQIVEENAHTHTHTHTHTRRHTCRYYRKRESFLDGANHFTTDWMLSSYRHFLYNDGTPHRDGAGWFLFR